ncbi:NAD(P)/FAD-dependent oxidoreductase [Agromyces italicus]|uniref:NAD(P)/FAD-dependent oxidoreductase n=1 Tax=Agromyces italicus TaxID=279572 RepID=UPI0003B6F392|nr:FAD-binding oxidoreductase [Agromyces italicus]
MKKPTVIVVGAGVIGCSLAAEFARRGATVAIIDAAEAASGTSASTFAWINGNDKSPEEYSLLNFLGVQAYEREAQRGGRWFHQTGMIQVAQSDQEAQTLETNVARIAWEDYGARVLTRNEVLELEPSLDPTRITGGAIYPREGWVDVETMCLSLLDRAIQSGATFLPFRSVAAVEQSHLVTVATDGTTQRHGADVIVVAAGNGTRGILANAGIDFPLLDPAENAEGAGEPGSSVGIISTTGRVQSGIRHFVRANGIALRPARNGGITFADHPTGGKWAKTDPQVWTVPGILLERARELCPALRDVAVESVHLGTRVLPRDGLTIADWADRDRSIYAVATHSGVTLAPHLATTVVDEVLDGVRHDSLAPFGLARFAAI